MANTEPTPGTAGDAVKQAFLALGGVQRSATIQRWIDEHFPGRWNDRTIYQHLRGCSVNQPTAIKYHPTFARFLFCHGPGDFEIYDSQKHGLFDDKGYREGEDAVPLDPVSELRELSEEIESRQFAYEAHLRDYLAKHLGLIETGLKLWTGEIGSSVEYPIDGRRIDILAKDSAGTPVIVELKLSRGHERTIGQALYYRGALKKMLSVDRVRIVVVASEIAEELRVASSEVPDVELFSYSLTMQVERIKNSEERQ